MYLDHPALEPFEPLLNTLHQYVFHAGIDALMERGIIRQDKELPSAIRESPSVLRRFLRGCHYGFDLAQRQIGAKVIEYELQARELRGEIKEFRRRRAKAEQHSSEKLLACIASRQLVLRRLVDSILQHLVHMEPWILRRTQVSDSIHPIDPVVLARMLRTAAGLNKEDRRTIHLVSDLTTAVQIGDLVRLSLDSEPRRWEIIELKDGRVNESLRTFLDQQGASISALDTANIEAEHGKHGVSQVQRMLRQRRREEEIEKFWTEDEGIDPKTNLAMSLIPEAVEVRDYFDPLKAACTRAKDTGCEGFVVSNCLRGLVVSNEVFRRAGYRGIAHLFYHLGLRGGTCELSSPENRDSEMDKISRGWPFHNLLRANLNAQWPSPVFMWPMPKEMLFDIVMGRLILLVQIDFEALFLLAREKGIEMSWVSDKAADPLMRRSPIIPGSPQSRGGVALIPGGSERARVFLMVGFFARMLLEFMGPEQLLTLVREMIDHSAQMITKKADSGGV
jgi:hypothetical protein